MCFDGLSYSEKQGIRLGDVESYPRAHWKLSAIVPVEIEMRFSELRRTISVFVICVFLLSCEKVPSKDSVTIHPNTEQQSGSHPAPEPNYEVKIDLPVDAAKHLSDSGETIILSASFADEIGPDGLYLGWFKAEVKTPGIIKISDVQFDQKIAALIPDKNYEVLMNVYSGRRSDDRNLLDCDALQGLISEFQGKTTVIKCALSNWASKPRKMVEQRFTGEMNGAEFKLACGSDVFQKAIDSKNEARTQFCIGLVKGIVNAADSFVSDEEYTGNRLFCLPRHMSDMDYTVLAIQRAEEPGINEGAGIGNTILGGLHKAFPCSI